MAEFKIGDKVRAKQNYNEFIEGEIYTVAYAAKYVIRLKEIKSDSWWWLKSRFESVESSEVKTATFKTNLEYDITMIVEDNVLKIEAGCFKGTLEQAKKRAGNRKQYNEILELIEIIARQKGYKTKEELKDKPEIGVFAMSGVYKKAVRNNSNRLEWKRCDENGKLIQ